MQIGSFKSSEVGEAVLTFVKSHIYNQRVAGEVHNLSTTVVREDKSLYKRSRRGCMAFV